MRALVLVAVLPAFALWSCSSEETPSASSSDSDDTDSDDTDDDDDVAKLCDAESSYDGDYVSSSQAVYYDSSTGIYTYFGELSSNGSESAFVYIELYPDAGAFADDEPHTGTFTIEDEDADYATCGICVFVLVGDGAGTSFDDYVVHMATEGELTITRLPTTSGGTFTASLENVTFEHVEIDADAGEATIADDGCDTTIADSSLSATLDDEDDDSGVCEANSSYSGDFESGGQSTTYDSINDTYAYYGQLVDTTSSGYTATFVMIQLYGGYGAFAGGDVTTGTFEISGDETNYSTCGVCVFVVPYDDADTSSTSDDVNAYYLATSGTVVVSTLTSSTLAGTLTDMAFEHVDIASSGTSTTNEDGCTTTIADAAFSSSITE